MKKLNQLLITLFVLQLAVAGGLYYGDMGNETETAQAALVTTDPKEVSHMTIEDNEGKQVVLKEVNGDWELPDYHHLPANKDKITALLDKLATAKTGWPVATTASSQERFEVAEEKYQRRLTLKKEEDVLEQLYVGTSPGFRKVHTRKAGEDEVYAIKLNVFDLPAEEEDWLDRTLIRPQGKITSVQGPDFHLKNTEGKWTVEGANLQVVEEEADKLMDALSNLQVRGASEIKAEQNTDDDYRLVLKAGGKETTYRFSEDKGGYYVKHPDYLMPFKLSKLDYEDISGHTADKLVKQVEEGEQSTDVEHHDH